MNETLATLTSDHALSEWNSMYFTAQQRHETEHPYAAETAAAEGQRVKMARWRNFVAISHNASLTELGQIWAAKTKDLAREKF